MAAMVLGLEQKPDRVNQVRATFLHDADLEGKLDGDSVELLCGAYLSMKWCVWQCQHYFISSGVG